jgi:hypothetical protein
MSQEHHKKETNVFASVGYGNRGFVRIESDLDTDRVTVKDVLQESKTDVTTSLGTFVTKDSGKRVEFASGMRRDVQEGKPRYDLIDRVYLKRLAELHARGAEKYGDNNWQLANSEEELKRFEASAFRHLMQYLEGDRSEDHACAVTFNLAAAEYVRNKLKK